MFCTKCGNKMAEGNSFCQKCGRKAAAGRDLMIPERGQVEDSGFVDFKPRRHMNKEPDNEPAGRFQPRYERTPNPHLMRDAIILGLGGMLMELVIIAMRDFFLLLSMTILYTIGATIYLAMNQYKTIIR